MTFRKAESIQSHKSETSFLPVISSCFEIRRIDEAAPIQRIPVAIPVNVPFPIFSFIGMLTLFFSIMQKLTVNSSKAANGIISALLSAFLAKGTDEVMKTEALSLFLLLLIPDILFLQDRHTTEHVEVNGGAV